MKITELEKAVLAKMIDDCDLEFVKSDSDFDIFQVKNREFTEVGFFTEFEKSEALKLFDEKKSFRWGKLGARLNTKIETGYLVYVDNGYVTMIEGYTYGEEWPKQVENIEIYDLIQGMELGIRN